MVAAVGAGGAFVLNAISFVGVMIVLYLWLREPERTRVSTESVGTAIWAGNALRSLRSSTACRAVSIRQLHALRQRVVVAAAVGGKGGIAPREQRVRLVTGMFGNGLDFSRDDDRAPAPVAFARRHRDFGNWCCSAWSTWRWPICRASARWPASCWPAAWLGCPSTRRLNTAAQTSLPAWVRARGLGVYLLVFQGAMAVGSVIWGAVADSHRPSHDAAGGRPYVVRRGRGYVRVCGSPVRENWTPGRHCIGRNPL